MKKRGFTLIELMVVIAIIGLLAAIALPRFANVSDSAKVANVQGNLSSIRTSISMYQAKNDAYPIFAGTAKDEDLTGIKNSSTGASDGVAFTEFYGKNVLANTPAENSTSIAETNIVVEATTISGNNISANGTGGWAYVNPTSTTTGAASGIGQIRANIPNTAYNETGIDWKQF